MQYGKIVDGGIWYSPTNYENIINFNTNEELMKEHGFKPAYDNPEPEYDKLYKHAYFKWVESEDKIEKVWEIVDRPQKDINKDLIEIYKKQLDDIDLKSIRAIRSNDTEYIAKYEAEAIELRNKIKELEVNENTVDN